MWPCNYWPVEGILGAGELRGDVTFSGAGRMNKTDGTARAERSKSRAFLMKRMQDGDSDAFRALLDDIGPAVTQFLRKRIADPNELEDIYQEVFMALYEARHTYEPARPFEPWLFAIARNVAVDHARRHWARARCEELTAEPPDRPHSDPLSAPPDLEDALEKLPPAQREAFSMLKLDGMSLEAAAARTGISVGALKVRAHRAYNALKKIIGGNE
jgi:RNA polymerase sigma-70 factor (ECF subfamily)